MLLAIARLITGFSWLALPCSPVQGNQPALLQENAMHRTCYQRLGDRAKVPVDLLECQAFQITDQRSLLTTWYYLTPDGHWLKDIKPDPSTGIVMRPDPLRSGLVEYKPTTILRDFHFARFPVPQELAEALRSDR